MSPIATIILAAITLSGVLALYLKYRQAAAVETHRGAVPGDFAATVSPAEHGRAADYTLANIRLGAAETIAETVIALVLLTLLLGPLYDLAGLIAPDGITRSVVVVLLIAALGEILDLPFDIAKTFGLEARFGFNRTTPGMFVLDMLKSAALQLAIGAPLLFGLFWLLKVLPDLWWILGFAASIVLMLGLAVIYPALIAPLFNKFTPMPEGPLKARIEALFDKCGFTAKGLFVMDASTRSTHGNAYFSGFGKAKRIVLFDTLLQHHTPDEILAVLAHEIGHYKFGHILQKIAQSVILSFCVFLVLHWAFADGHLASEFGLANDPGIVFIIVVVAMGPAFHLLSPLTSFLSRRAEFEADGFARTMVGAGPMIGALTKLSRDNLATLTPDALYARFYYSHPPVPVRIAQLRRS
jgi:STE24 endopeptidase